MIIAMAGLPGTGKSTLARAIADELPAIILNKDNLRASLFPSDEISYTNTQDDFVINIAFQIANFYFQKDPSQKIILDGRTFSIKSQVSTLVDYGKKHNWDIRFIYCTCSEETAKARIESDAANKKHMAANRDFNLYKLLKTISDPLDFPHLIVDTEKSIEVCTSKCLDYLKQE